MDELGTALRTLAGNSRPVGDLPVGDLWDRGRARVRRRRVIGAGIGACVLALVALLGTIQPTPQVAMPAGSPHRAALPRDIYLPPPWLSGTDRPGPLGVLGAATRHGRTALFGISATTGAYHFLDLAHLATANGSALSPDGLQIAYWSTGSPSGKAFPTEGEQVITGLSVLDLMTGTVNEFDPYTRHGLALVGDITWLNAKTLAFSYGQKITATAANRIASYTWTPPSADKVVRADLRGFAAGYLSRDRDGTVRLLASPSAGYDASLRPQGDALRLPAGANDNYTAISRSGSLVVAVGNVGQDTSSNLYVGHLGRVGTGIRRLVVALTRLTHLYVGNFFGWTSPDTILVSAWKPEPENVPSLYTIRVTDGTMHRLGVAGEGSDSVRGVAVSLLEDGFVDGRHPPRVDPRIIRTGAAVVVLAALAGLLWWRRRARA